MSEEVFEPSSSDVGPTGQVPWPTPESNPAPIALPPATPPSGTPAQGSTPPQGMPLPMTPPPASTYALGALAGNPNLGATPPSHQGPPPPSAPPNGYWGPPPVGPPAAGAKRGRAALALTAVGTALVLIAGSVAVGHAVWGTPSAPTAAASNANGGGGAGSGNLPSGNNSNPFGGYQYGGGGGGFSPNSGSGSTSSVGSGPSDSSSIASKVDPGLVDINTTLGYQSEEAAGTGIVVTSNGEILTNNHVVEGATTISVTDVGNHKTYSASVVGYDRTKDVAVLQLHGASGLQTATIGDASSLSVGQQVVGIGNAGGSGGTPSYAGGTITALNQSITASDEGDSTAEQLTGLIETNADIQAGDSGGSLVNTNGQVIGMDTAASAGFSFQNQSSQGFAIPINTALSIARQIVAGNASSTVHIGETAFLGVSIEPDASTGGGGNGNGFFGGSGFNNGSGNQVAGATIAGVITSSPAQTAGLAEGDVITSVNSTSIATGEALTDAMEAYHPGNKVTIGWTDSSGNTHHASVQLTSGPPQ